MHLANLNIEGAGPKFPNNLTQAHGLSKDGDHVRALRGGNATIVIEIVQPTSQENYRKDRRTTSRGKSSVPFESTAVLTRSDCNWIDCDAASPCLVTSRTESGMYLRCSTQLVFLQKLLNYELNINDRRKYHSRLQSSDTIFNL